MEIRQHLNIHERYILAVYKLFFHKFSTCKYWFDLGHTLYLGSKFCVSFVMSSDVFQLSRSICYEGCSCCQLMSTESSAFFLKYVTNLFPWKRCGIIFLLFKNSFNKDQKVLELFPVIVNLFVILEWYFYFDISIRFFKLSWRKFNLFF